MIENSILIRFAYYFADIYKNEFEFEYNSMKAKSLCRFKILWSGDLLLVVKSFGTADCRLYNDQKLANLTNLIRRRNK